MASAPKAPPTGQDQQVARILDEARKDRGMSQGRLADLVGISQPQMSRILAGKRAMTLTEFSHICDALGLTSWEVIRDADA